MALCRLLRALVKTNPNVTSNRASEMIATLGLLEGQTNSITLDRFLAIHDILRGASYSA